MSRTLRFATGISLDEPFRLPGGGRGLFTSREAGNLSLAAGIGHEQGLSTRERLCEQLSLQWLCAAPQVHGTDVKRVTEFEERGGRPCREAADGHATALPGIGTLVLAADCVPVILASRGAVAAIHAGWRGLADGVVEAGVAALVELSGDERHGGERWDQGAQRGEPPDERSHGGERSGEGSRGGARSGGGVSAVIGPCAGACCYEVGEEVLDRFSADLGDEAPRPDADGKAKLDLRRLAERRLSAAGVTHVAHLSICTICDERTFSHRREGAAAGRHGAIAWLVRAAWLGCGIAGMRAWLQ